MQFAILIYQGSMPLPNTEEWKSLPAETQKAIFAGYGAINQNPAVTPGVSMAHASQAKTVRVEDDKAAISDGPFMGIDGAVGGYLVFEAENEAVALQFAATIPAAKFGGAVEVRPVVNY
jgi:hypothetical protein